MVAERQMNIHTDTDRHTLFGKQFQQPAVGARLV